MRALGLWPFVILSAALMRVAWRVKSPARFAVPADSVSILPSWRLRNINVRAIPMKAMIGRVAVWVCHVSKGLALSRRKSHAPTSPPVVMRREANMKWKVMWVWTINAPKAQNMVSRAMRCGSANTPKARMVRVNPAARKA